MYILNNQECTTQPTLINLHPNEYSEGLNYYTSAVNFGRCVGIKNTLDDYQIEYVFHTLFPYSIFLMW